MIVRMPARSLVATAILLCLGISLNACATAGGEPPPILSKQSPVALRAMQIRAFDTTSKRRMIQAVIATLQDLGYTVEKIDYPSGTISAAKLEALRLTVVIYPHGPSQISVRANAIVRVATASTQVDDPEFYRKLFFEPLSRAVFLAALQTEDDVAAPTPPLPPAPPVAPASKPQLKS
jgi:hypothetical protein